MLSGPPPWLGGRYLDNSVFAPYLCCDLKKGVATEEDLNYCCFCINCVCIYDLCTKPCCGGMVAAVHDAAPPHPRRAGALPRPPAALVC